MQTRFKLEKDFQSEIFQNAQIKQDICECLKIDYKAAKFIKEDKYINGLTADFSILENGVVRVIRI